MHTKRQALLLGKILAERNIKVAYAMRYGEPSIAEGLKKLSGCEVVVVPLYPQFSRSTTESIRDVLPPGAKMIEQFHDHPAYIAALAARRAAPLGGARQGRQAGDELSRPAQALGRPGDPYQTQCIATAKILAGVLRLAPADYLVTFQSRFGAAEWLQPYTEPTLVALAQAGHHARGCGLPGLRLGLPGNAGGNRASRRRRRSSARAAGNSMPCPA